MSSENDFLQPNTGDIPLETIDHLRKLTAFKYCLFVWLFMYIILKYFILWFRTNETETNSPQ